MTVLTLTRPAHSRPPSIEAIRDGLTRHLHTRVHPREVQMTDAGMTVTCDVTAPRALVEIACAAVVKAPVMWEVSA